MSNYTFPRGEKEFNKFLVREYLKHGSVEEAFRVNKYSLPVSSATYHRVVEKWGIIKAAGPNNKLNEALEFFVHLARGTHSLEKLYAKMPPSFRTSAVTLYRILSYIKEGITRRVGTALVITPFGNLDNILLAKDYSTPRIELGKPFGSLTIPMGFSKKSDPREDAILRVLQQEVFTDCAVKNNMPNVIPNHPKPFMYLDIADVRVEIFHIDLPKNLSSSNQFSSFKLSDFKFISRDKILSKTSKLNYRVGVKEATQGFQKYVELKSRNLEVNPIFEQSQLNYAILTQMASSG